MDSRDFISPARQLSIYSCAIVGFTSMTITASHRLMNAHHKSKSGPPEFSRAIENLIANFRGLPEDETSSKRRQTTDLSSIIDELLVKYRISHNLLEDTIREKWPELVGAANASYSHPLVVERQQLIVLVSHAVVRNELFHHQSAILEKVHKLPGCAKIKGVTLRIG